ncbi:hypothetical protein BESB_060730 [Besnoitia besnoiti]|uniref:Uncharacterized protein n=1 Tax=Besnoitia besnoiti TaxID=94643 RepID=A0A2A9MGV0_BESBE|nr:hypothetical protein BESB_060730 [Besnoitia besnoiti]PFH35186.1 hypothetical protein BESB_060730 [Besnoitia besnoiti]
MMTANGGQPSPPVASPPSADPSARRQSPSSSPLAASPSSSSCPSCFGFSSCTSSASSSLPPFPVSWPHGTPFSFPPPSAAASPAPGLPGSNRLFAAASSPSSAGAPRASFSSCASSAASSAGSPASHLIYFPPPLVCPPSVAPFARGDTPPGPLGPAGLAEPQAEGCGSADRSRGRPRDVGDEARRSADASQAREDGEHVDARRVERERKDETETGGDGAQLQEGSGSSPHSVRKPRDCEAAAAPWGSSASSHPADPQDRIRCVPLNEVFPTPQEQASYASTIADVYARQLDMWYWYARQLSMQLDLVRLSSATHASNLLAGFAADGSDVLLNPAGGVLGDGFAAPLGASLLSVGAGPLVPPTETPASPPSPIDASTSSRMGGVGAVFRLCGLEFRFGRNPGAQGAGPNPLGFTPPDAVPGEAGTAEGARGSAQASAATSRQASSPGGAQAASSLDGRAGEAEGEEEAEAAAAVNNAWDQYNIGVFVKLLLLLFLFDAGREVYIVTLLSLLLHVNGFFDPLIMWMRRNSHTQPLEVTLARLRHRQERRPLRALQRRQRELRTATDFRQRERGGGPSAEEAQNPESQQSPTSAASSSFSVGEANEGGAGIRRRVPSPETGMDEGRSAGRQEAQGGEGGRQAQESPRQREALRPTYFQRVIYQGIVMFFFTFLPWWNPDPVFLEPEEEDEEESEWPGGRPEDGGQDDFGERVHGE